MLNCNLQLSFDCIAILFSRMNISLIAKSEELYGYTGALTESMDVLSGQEEASKKATGNSI